MAAGTLKRSSQSSFRPRQPLAFLRAVCPAYEHQEVHQIFKGHLAAASLRFHLPDVAGSILLQIVPTTTASQMQSTYESLKRTRILYAG